jgi:hypothetical protein
MTKLKPGDRVDCRLKEGNIVVAYKDYDEVRTFEIIAVSDDDCYLFIPSYVLVKDSILLDSYRCKKLGADPRFVGEQVAFIGESMIHKISQRMDGMCCDRCQDFMPMAGPNQEDGKTFICWSCRANRYH